MTKLKWIKHYTILDDIYRRHFQLVVNVPADKFIKWIKSHNDNQEWIEKIEESIDGACGLYCFGIWDFNYLWLEKFDWTIKDQWTLVHELNHHVDYTFDAVGIEMTAENSEARSYYFEYIFKKCYEELKHLHENVKRKKWLKVTSKK